MAAWIINSSIIERNRRQWKTFEILASKKRKFCNNHSKRSKKLVEKKKPRHKYNLDNREKANWYDERIRRIDENIANALIKEIKLKSISKWISYTNRKEWE